MYSFHHREGVWIFLQVKVLSLKQAAMHSCDPSPSVVRQTKRKAAFKNQCIFCSCVWAHSESWPSLPLGKAEVPCFLKKASSINAKWNAKGMRKLWTIFLEWIGGDPELLWAYAMICPNMWYSCAAPEIIKGTVASQQDDKSDIWSCGVVLLVCPPLPYLPYCWSSIMSRHAFLLNGHIYR